MTSASASAAGILAESPGTRSRSVRPSSSAPRRRCADGIRLRSAHKDDQGIMSFMRAAACESTVVPSIP